MSTQKLPGVRGPLQGGPGGPHAPGSARQSRPDSPGHHQELVDLLVYERVVRLPHLGLQFGLVAAILLACTDTARLRETEEGPLGSRQGPAASWGPTGTGLLAPGATSPPAGAGGARDGP